MALPAPHREGHSPVASTSKDLFVQASAQPVPAAASPVLAPMSSTSTTPLSSPARSMHRQLSRRRYSDKSDESPLASREGSPSSSSSIGPVREKRRPVIRTTYLYDSPTASSPERFDAGSMSRSHSRSSSPGSTGLLAASPVSTVSPRSVALPSMPALSLRPASPNHDIGSASVSSSRHASPIGLSPNGSLASKRQRNKKLLSLNIPATSPSQESVPGGSSRSLPPSPLLEARGEAAAEHSDVDEMRANVRGGLSMSRRPSIPHRVASAVDKGTTTDPIRLIGRNGEDGMADADESFPYQHGPREILPGVYLGSEQNAKDVNCLRQLSISHILNVAKEVHCPWERGPRVEEACDVLDATHLSTADSRACSSGDSSPTRSDISVSPSSAATTVSRASTDRAKSTSIETDAKDGHPRPSLYRSTASTPNLQAAFAAPSDTPMTSHSTSAVSAPNSVAGLTVANTQRFPADTATGRPELEYLHLPWGHDEDNLVARFPTAFAFVDRAIARDGRILIHCQCGVSRSATAAIAYVMRQAVQGQVPALAGLSGMHEAYQYVKDRSAWITPNMSLLFQLMEWEHALSSATSSSTGLTPPMARLDTPFGGVCVHGQPSHAMDVDHPR